MPYDRDSFLAGIAVGRNMQGWPDMHGSGPGGAFAYTINVTWGAAHAYYLRLALHGEIHWGDGTKTPVNGDTYLGKTYRNNGIYQIVIIGDLQDITLGDRGMGSGTDGQAWKDSARSVISVDTPFYAVPEAQKPAYKNIEAIFYDCENLRSIPKDLFKYWREDGVYLVNAEDAFYNCKSLTIPPALLKGITIGNTNSGTVYLAAMFHGCQFRTISADLLKVNNPDNNIVDARGIFNGCSELMSIEDGLFDALQNIKRFDSVFKNCPHLEQIPDNLFSEFPDVTSFYQAFQFCGRITGNVPELWNIYPGSDGRYCYEGCINASNYDSIPYDWGGPRPST